MLPCTKSIGSIQFNKALNPLTRKYKNSSLSDSTMENGSYIHAFLISWTGQELNAYKLSNELVTYVDRLTVIFSDEFGSHQTGAGEWIRVSNDWFFGKKFAECIKLFSGDIFFQVQADASFPRWGALIESCKQAHKGDVGVWAPDINFTPWVTEVVKLLDGPTRTAAHVMQTDGIVWSLDKRVVNRIRALDLQDNNFGWGIDWAAVAFSYASRLQVLRERAFTVSHPRGSGYSGAQAQAQMVRFFQQLSPLEKEIIFSFENVIQIRRDLLNKSN
jgi:hypothetical protein